MPDRLRSGGPKPAGQSQVAGCSSEVNGAECADDAGREIVEVLRIFPDKLMREFTRRVGRTDDERESSSLNHLKVFVITKW